MNLIQSKLAFFLIIISTQAFGQLNLAKQHSGVSIKDTTLLNQPLVDGTLHTWSKKSSTTHSFLFSKTWLTGDVKFKGEWYLNQKIIYDIYEHLVLIGVNYNGSYVPHLINQNYISEFIINGKRFIKSPEKELPLYKGYMEVVASHPDFISYIFHNKTADLDYGNFIFKTSNKYFLFKDGKYHAIKFKFQLTKLFKEHKQAINQYCRDNSYKLGNGNDFEFLMITNHIKSLMQ